MTRFNREIQNKDSKGTISPRVYLILALSIFLLSFTNILLKHYLIKMLVEGILIILIIFSAFYILAKLINRFKVPNKDDVNFREEFIEFHEDHVSICSMSQVVAQQRYNYAKIYYDDIKCTYINAQYLEIILISKPSLNSQISNASKKNNHFRMFVWPYPKEMIRFLKNDFRFQMKC